jgi:S-adenosylmethionine synthetase
MMQALVITALEEGTDAVEVVERKGLGHPDTICDALAETLSRNLSREYRRRFGDVLHHNVDKALLRGGQSAPTFGGGTVLAPISIFLAGRAVTDVGGKTIPVEEMAIEGSKAWLRANLHALNPEQHVHIHNLIRPGSQELQELFSRRRQSKVLLANDTSVGLGYAPMSPLERLVLAVEKRINGRDRNTVHPAWGEDIKIMAVRRGSSAQMTVACAMIGGYLSSIDDYLREKSAVEGIVRTTATEHGFPQCCVYVNAADDPSSGALYLTVTGTSAEAGDDGQVGRGNRANGLITPYRPMMMEAAAGKNPVTHVGKIYSVVARQIAEALIAEEPQVSAAQCFLVGQIGAPVTEPALVHVKLATRGEMPVSMLERRVEELARTYLGRTSSLVESFIAGSVDLF